MIKTSSHQQLHIISAYDLTNHFTIVDNKLKPKNYNSLAPSRMDTLPTVKHKKNIPQSK